MKDAHQRELREQFNNATGLLQAQRYEDAADALRRCWRWPRACPRPM